MTLFENLLRKTHIPEWFNSLIPRQSKYILKIWNFLWGIIFRFGIKSINFYLNKLSNTFRHIHNFTQFLIKSIFLRLLVFINNFLKSSFNYSSLRSIFEILCCHSNHHDFHLNQFVKFLEKINNFLSSLNWICHFNELPLFLNKFLKTWNKSKSIENFEIISCHSKCILVKNRINWSSWHIIKCWILKMWNNVLIQILSWEWDELEIPMNSSVINIPSLLHIIQNRAHHLFLFFELFLILNFLNFFFLSCFTKRFFRNCRFLSKLFYKVWFLDWKRQFYIINIWNCINNVIFFIEVNYLESSI